MNVSSVLAQFKSTIILFEKGYECVALSELYGSQDHMLNYFYGSEQEVFYLLQIVIEICIF